MTGPVVIERLARSHDRQSFDCGVRSLNEFLQKHARQNAEEDVSRTYVAISIASSPVLGFYTICSGSVEREHMPDATAKRLPRYPVPVINLARLAVDVSQQGLGLGRNLVVDALRRVQRIAEEVGIRAVTVDAIDDRARHFYEKFGFEPLLDDRLHLFLQMSAIRKLNL
jgi:ribosomal protein S18 acetylase RimI-like enzyme